MTKNKKLQEIKPNTLLVHHVKGQPDISTYVQEKGFLTFDTHRETPCILVPNSELYPKPKITKFSGVSAQKSLIFCSLIRRLCARKCCWQFPASQTGIIHSYQMHHRFEAYLWPKVQPSAEASSSAEFSAIFSTEVSASAEGKIIDLRLNTAIKLTKDT